MEFEFNWPSGFRDVDGPTDDERTVAGVTGILYSEKQLKDIKILLTLLRLGI